MTAGGAAPQPYGLFWSSRLPGASGAALDAVPRRRPGFLPLLAPLGLELQVVAPPPLEAIILFPALFTPALVELGGALELLLLAPAAPPEGVITGGSWISAELVNRHLKVAPGLGPAPSARPRGCRRSARRRFP